MVEFLDMLCAKADIQPLVGEETALEIACREKDGKRYWFVMNLTGKPQPMIKAFAGKTDILKGRSLNEGEMLENWDTLLYEEKA